MKQVAALIAAFIIIIGSNAQRAEPPLPPATNIRSDSGVIIAGPANTAATPNGGQDEYRKKYKELVDSLALKNENELKKNYDDLSASYRYAIYGIVAAGILICVLLGIVYGLYHKNKTLKSELNKLKP